MLNVSRGPKKPSYKVTGISHLQLIRFLEQCQLSLEKLGEEKSAVRFEMVKEYFKQDYKPGEPLNYSSSVLGL